MLRVTALSVLTITTLLSLAAIANDSEQVDTDLSPDLIFFNGTIHTIGEQRSVVEALAVKDGLILSAGQKALLLELAGENTQLVDMQGGSLFPGIDLETDDPENGRIERDPTTGVATGTLRESATSLVADILPQPTLEAVIDDLKAGVSFQNSYGFTASIEAAVKPGLEEQAFVSLAQHGKLSIRTELSMLPTQDFTDSDLDVTQLEGRIESLNAHRGNPSVSGRNRNLAPGTDPDGGRHD